MNKFDFEQLRTLPEPVKKYFLHVLSRDQAWIRQVQIHQKGVLRTDMKSNQWLSFDATQVVSPIEKSFEWSAKVQMGPWLHVRVVDSYRNGIGAGNVKFLSLIPLGGDLGTLEMNSGSLHRYLAEGVWYPTGLLPQSGVQWTAIDSGRALAAIEDHGVRVEVEFRFNDKNEIISMYSPGRWGKFKDGYKQVAWEGHFKNYVTISGMQIPSYGEVGWYSEGQWQKVWEGSSLEIKFTF